MKESIIKYLQTEANIQLLNEKIKNERNKKDKLSEEIIGFCRQNSKSKINLPDGSTLLLNKTKSYQSLTYNMIEEKLHLFNKKYSINIPVDKFIDFLKASRQNKESFELKHKFSN